MVDKAQLWTVMPLMAVGTYLIRFSFLGMLGNRPLPTWLTRALRYTAVAVLPGLVLPAFGILVSVAGRWWSIIFWNRINQLPRLSRANVVASRCAVMSVLMPIAGILHTAR